MSLIGIPPTQKIPGAVVTDLRDYAVALSLPVGWEKQVTIRTEEMISYGSGVTRWFVDYVGSPLASYELDCLGGIVDSRRHRPIPPPVDPLVVASQLAVSQPADSQWRRFKHLIFRREEIAAVNNVDEKGHENGKEFMIMLRNGQSLICGNEKNYANSGMSTFDFFVEHCLELRPANADRSSNR